MTTADQIAMWGVLATALTPVAVIGVGYWVNRRLKHVERTFERERRLTEVRFDLYKEIGFKLNDLFAYFNFVGLWKELSCQDVIERKRELDRHVYAYRPLFTSEFFDRYVAFTDAAFKTNTGWRKDAKLRTFTDHREEHGNRELMECFTQEDNRVAIRTAYEGLLDCLATNLGLSSESAAQ